MMPCGEVWNVAKTGTTSAPRARAMRTSSAPATPKSTLPDATICTTGTPAPPPWISTSSPCFRNAPASRAA